MHVIDWVISHFFLRERIVTRYRDKATGRFISTPMMYRFSAALNSVPFHGKYKSFLFQYYSKFPLDQHELQEKYFDALAWFQDRVGYPQSEWWFDSQIGLEENAEFQYDKNLVGRTFRYVEK